MEIAKVVQVVSSSKKSFDDAVTKGVKNASKTIRGISGVKVTDWTATVKDDEIVRYRVTMDIAFGVEG